VKTLLIDIGNSRIKWTLRRGVRLGRQQVLPLQGSGADAFAQIAARARGAAAVVAVSVAGTARERALAAALRAAGLPAVRWIRSTRSAAGLRNGYRDVWRLGADRWVAAIGAWHAAGGGRPVCVVDIGTAATLDVIDAQGRHRGGLIAPGPQLMVQSLLRGTRGIAVRASGGRRVARPGLARDTAAALQGGASEATLALIERTAGAARREHGPRTQLFVTGGGARDVKRLLSVPFHDCPDLVLRGLAVLADLPPGRD
jgi:type III pantothenate kinase